MPGTGGFLPALLANNWNGQVVIGRDVHIYASACVAILGIGLIC